MMTNNPLSVNHPFGTYSKEEYEFYNKACFRVADQFCRQYKRIQVALHLVCHFPKNFSWYVKAATPLQASNVSLLTVQLLHVVAAVPGVVGDAAPVQTP